MLPNHPSSCWQPSDAFSSGRVHTHMPHTYTHTLRLRKSPISRFEFPYPALSWIENCKADCKSTATAEADVYSLLILWNQTAAVLFPPCVATGKKISMQKSQAGSEGSAQSTAVLPGGSTPRLCSPSVRSLRTSSVAEGLLFQKFHCCLVPCGAFYQKRHFTPPDSFGIIQLQVHSGPYDVKSVRAVCALSAQLQLFSTIHLKPKLNVFVCPNLDASPQIGSSHCKPGLTPSFIMCSLSFHQV